MTLEKSKVIWTCRLSAIHSAIEKLPKFSSDFWDFKPEMTLQEWQIARAKGVQEAIDSFDMENCWFILMDGNSPDGRGEPTTYSGRTSDPDVARRFLKGGEAQGGYWTGHVKIYSADRFWQVREIEQFDRIISDIAPKTTY